MIRSQAVPSVEPPMYGRSEAGTRETTVAHQKLETANATVARASWTSFFFQPSLDASRYTAKTAGRAM